jgi:hypothetical protein
LKKILLVLLFILSGTGLWAIAQEKKETVPPPAQVTPTPETKETEEKKGVSSPLPINSIPEDNEQVDQKQIPSFPSVTPTAESSKSLEKEKVESSPSVNPVLEGSKSLEQKKIESSPSANGIPEQSKVLEGKSIESPPSVNPISEGSKSLEQKKIESSPNLSPIGETKLQKETFSIPQVGELSPLQERTFEIPQRQFNGGSPVQGVDGMNYQVQEFNNFGGLNLSNYKTKISPTDAYDVENALWNEQGEIYKRNSFSVSATNVPVSVNFLYRYYKQDGSKFTIMGNDTALFWARSDSNTFHLLKGTGGITGRWDGTTFDDKFVGTHEGIAPVIWDGSVVIAMGVLPDSFYVDYGISDYGYNNTPPCSTCSSWVTITPNPGWVTDQWVGYTVRMQFWMESSAYWGYFNIIGNGANKIYVRGKVDAVNYSYIKLYSWFQWTKIYSGKIDSVAVIPDCWVELWEKDTTISYPGEVQKYLFQATTGTGAGKFLYVYYVGTESGKTKITLNGYEECCFDTSTHYTLWQPSFWVGSKYCETFDNRLWLGWTGVGADQEKNRLVFSELNELNNFPPENNIWIGGDDGDYITGMKAWEGSYVDVPRGELIVSKQASLYKVVPSNDVLLYHTWCISPDVGCISNSTMQTVEDKFLIFADQHGIYGYDKTKVAKISSKIDSIFYGWDFANLEKACAIYNPQDRHYYLSYPEGTSNDKALAWNIDFNRWSRESFVAKAYAYQHSISDTIKVIFAKNSAFYDSLCRYGRKVDTGVILTYQTPYLSFDPHPSFETWIKVLTIEASLDTGKIYIDWFKDYGTTACFRDSISCGNDCRKEFSVVDSVKGKNISMKITTSGVGKFTLPRLWWEYEIDTKGRK